MNINPEWIFGFSKDIPSSVHDLSTDKRNALFYVSSQYGVIYDYNKRSQILLQGHRNNISCCCVSLDKKWIVTADEGDDSIVLIWDALNGIPMKSIYSMGIKSVDMSGDSMFLVTIGSQNDVAVWAWTQQSSELISQERLQSASESFIRFHPSDKRAFVSWGSDSLTFWRQEISDLVGCTFSMSKLDSNGNMGSITCVSLKRDHAIACTSEGYAILWSHSDYSNLPMNGGMKPVKVVKLTESGINTCNVTDKYIVVGCRDGSVRFYDDHFRLEAWYEDLNAGSIVSISFCSSPTVPSVDTDKPKFHCSDFIVSTIESFIIKLTSSMFNQVLVEDRRGILLLQGLAGRVNKLSCHSSKPTLAISCENGMIQLWNYELMLLLNVRDFSTTMKGFTEKTSSGTIYPSAISFPPVGTFLAVGFTNGLLKIVNGDSLEDISTFAPTSNVILDIQFSKDATFMSCYDDSGYVMVFKHFDSTYDYIGRVHSHLNAITGLSFGFHDKNELLLSIGSDGKCVEYDLSLTSMESGVVVNNNSKSSTILDSSVFPTALCWHPQVTNGVEDRFVAAFNNFKIREFNAESKRPRKTASMLTPESGWITKMIPIKGDSVTFMAYCSNKQSVGLCSLPLTGNPNHNITFAAHPNEVSDIAVSFDGRHVFSAGGKDLNVNKWSYHFESNMNDDIDDYYALLDGGKTGKVYNEIVDYLYYCQIRAQGESAIDKRDMNGKIPISEIPSLMRAVGFYPSEYEIENMWNEIRYQDFLVSGKIRSEASLEDVIKLYLNFKPLNPATGSLVAGALEKIMKRISNTSNTSTWNELIDVLTSHGEAIVRNDLELLIDSLRNSMEKQKGSEQNPVDFVYSLLEF